MHLRDQLSVIKLERVSILISTHVKNAYESSLVIKVLYEKNGENRLITRIIDFLIQF